MVLLITLIIVALLIWYFWTPIAAFFIMCFEFLIDAIIFLVKGALLFVLVCFIVWLIKIFLDYLNAKSKAKQARAKWEAEAPLREAEERRRLEEEKQRREAERRAEQLRQEAYEREREKEREREARREAKREQIRNIVETRISSEIRNPYSLAFKLLKENGYLDSSKDWKADICNPKSAIHRAFKGYGYFK